MMTSKVTINYVEWRLLCETCNKISLATLSVILFVYRKFLLGMEDRLIKCGVVLFLWLHSVAKQIFLFPFHVPQHRAYTKKTPFESDYYFKQNLIHLFRPHRAKYLYIFEHMNS